MVHTEVADDSDYLHSTLDLEEASLDSYCNSDYVVDIHDSLLLLASYSRIGSVGHLVVVVHKASVGDVLHIRRLDHRDHLVVVVVQQTEPVDSIAVAAVPPYLRIALASLVLIPMTYYPFAYSYPLHPAFHPLVHMVACIVAVAAVGMKVSSFDSFHRDVDSVAFSDYIDFRHHHRHDDFLHCYIVRRGRHLLANRPRSYPDPPRLDYTFSSDCDDAEEYVLVVVVLRIHFQCRHKVDSALGLRMVENPFDSVEDTHSPVDIAFDPVPHNNHRFLRFVVNI